MGTWGPGNLDSDSAGGHLDSILDELVRLIRTCFSSQIMQSDEWFFEMYGEPKLMPTIDIFLTLIEKYGILPSDVTTDEVKQWKETYLKIYDRVIDKFAKPEHKVERRQVIEDTFSGLEQLVHEWENL
jgi:hypothetical protein